MNRKNQNKRREFLNNVCPTVAMAFLGVSLLESCSSGGDDILEELGKNTQRPSMEDSEIPVKNIEFMSKKKKNSKRGGIQIDI